MQTSVDRTNDVLWKRKDVMTLLKIKSCTTYQKWRRESGVKGMQISGGIEVFWKSDIIKYLEELQNNVA
jgi:hypothetical protein